MRVLVTRPEPDASRQAAELAARGHDPVLAPLLEIALRPEVALPLDQAQALIVTSRNALRAMQGHKQLAEALNLPLYAVGEATARAASALGFSHVIAGPGTGEALAARIGSELEPKAGPLVHLAGDVLAFDLKSVLEAQGFEFRQPVLYAATPAKALPPEALVLLRQRRLNGAILMSPRTAAILAALVQRHGVITEASGLVCYCLSPAVAKAAEPLGCSLVVAARPREEDILALIDAETASSA